MSQGQQLVTRAIRYHCGVVDFSGPPPEHDLKNILSIFAYSLDSAPVPDPYSVCNEPPQSAVTKSRVLRTRYELSKGLAIRPITSSARMVVRRRWNNEVLTAAIVKMRRPARIFRTPGLQHGFVASRRVL